MKIKLLFLSLLLSVSIFSYSQQDSTTLILKKLQKLKVSGYIQAQAEYGQYDEALGEGAITRTGTDTKYNKGKDNGDGFLRYGIRRGRLKFDYTEGIAKGVFQLDITEGGIGIKDAYLELSVPCKKQSEWDKIFGLRAGIFNRPFGNEITYSSSYRETPERTFLYNKLFPDERDLGAMIIIKAPKSTFLEGLKLEAGLFSGNGVRKDDNGKLDFIGHLKYDKSKGSISYGIGASYYRGTVNNSYYNTYNIFSDGEWGIVDFNEDTTLVNKTNKREYFGFDGQFSIKTTLGYTKVRAEVIIGEQPSQKNDFSSPKGNSYDESKPFNYIRNFYGGHIYLIQDIYKTPLTFVIKYSYLDPNYNLEKNQIKNKSDIAYSTLSIGGYWTIRPELRFMASYDINWNETTNKIASYKRDIKDNLFTLRLQYKF